MVTDLVGRKRETHLIDTLLDEATVRGRALALWGEPGIGKTALLEYAAGRVRGVLVRARGVEAESMLPFVAVADLLGPLRRYIRAVPRPQRHALETCLALQDGAPANLYAACAGALGTVAAASASRPLAVLVDDVHWVDQPSWRVLGFIARRVSSTRIALVLAGLDDGRFRSLRRDVPSVRLSGLTHAQSETLLRRHGFAVGPGVLVELGERCGGNPLALLEAAASLRPGQLSGVEPLGHGPSGHHLTHLLSAQEMRIALAVASGMTNPEVATALFLSRKTVEAHLTRLYRKLEVRSRTDLARTLARAGLVD